MTSKTLAKQERVVESVRLGLHGEAAVEFVHANGYAITEAGLSRYVRTMGGLERIQELIEEGKSNIEILEALVPERSVGELKKNVVRGASRSPNVVEALRPEDTPLYETAKMTVHLPADLYEAIRLAARAEGKTQNQLIVDLLTTALSQIPRLAPEEPEDRPS